MRIALVTETFFPAVDGTTTTVKAIADRLVGAGHEVLVIAPATVGRKALKHAERLGVPTLVVEQSPLLVHPGERETCCHALREPAVSGVPVVAPRSGGAPDVVRHLETGLLYDPADEHGPVCAVGHLRPTGTVACSAPGRASSHCAAGPPRSTSWWSATTCRWSPAGRRWAELPGNRT